MYKVIIILSCIRFVVASSNTYNIKSPDQQITIIFKINESSEPEYQLYYKNKIVIEPSKLLIDLKDQPDFINNFFVFKVDTSCVDEEWLPVWGEMKSIKNNYNELTVTLQQKDIKDRNLIIRFRLFDDGLGFRYEFPRQDALQYFIVSDELTQFNFSGDHTLFWIPGDYDTNEYTYSITAMSEVDATRGLMRSKHH